MKIKCKCINCGHVQNAKEYDDVIECKKCGWYIDVDYFKTEYENTECEED